MKIWHVGAAPNPFRVDGVSRTVWLMSVEQARLGHDVSLILHESPSPEAVSMAGEVGLKLLDVSATPLAYARHVRELLDAIPPQIVHMHSVFIPRQAILARALRKSGVPYVITPHAGLAPQVLARGWLKKSAYSILKERPRFMGAAAIALVTPAEENAVRSYVPGYKGIIRWMPNPVDFSVLDPHRWQGLTAQPRMVFLGRFDVLVKGIDILIEIARLLPEVQVDLYGTEDPKTLDWLMKLKENLPRNVTFHDPIFGSAKAEVLSRASIYVQPSRWEGFPVSVAECLYLGVPSSIADTLDLAELFQKHGLGLVLSLKPEIAARQIRESLENAARLQEWSKRGREFALKHFAPKVVAQNHVGLYEEVAKASPQRIGTGSVAHGGANGRAEPAAHGSNGHATALRHKLVPTHFRSALKHNVSRLFERSSDLLGTSEAARTIVLCYHSISDDPNGLAIQPATFARQIAVLREMGYEFLTFGDLVHRVMCTGSPRENVAVLTFDDGFEDNFTTAVPIMQKLNVPGTFFITSGLLERDSNVIASFRRLTGYEAPYLSAAQARQMYEGGFEIGAHTHTHPNLRRLAAGRARWEVMHSKQVLEGVIGGAVRSFAYPFGKRHIHYTAETVNFVREAGYAGSGAVAFRGVTSRKSVRIYEIPRFFITRGDGEEQFRQKVSGHFDWLGSFQELSPAWLKGLISPEDRY